MKTISQFIEKYVAHPSHGAARTADCVTCCEAKADLFAIIYDRERAAVRGFKACLSGIDVTARGNWKKRKGGNRK